jgi:SAM-dependent methyltransferase
LLKRTSINVVNETLKNNKNWKILDIGCGYSANIHADVIADVQDLSNYYKNRKFIIITEDKLPFKDKEFDFVIASHVIEHVENFEFFIKELQRISSKGYIELPTRFADNLIFENKKDHIWWFVFDDINNQLIASKKNQLIEPFINVSTGKMFEKFFRESFVFELLWNDKIDYRIDNSLRNGSFKKISFYKLIKKFFSKKIRRFFRN